MAARKKRTNKSTDGLVFLPLGGCGEIGMNLYLYGFGPAGNRQWLMVDLGIKFGDERDPGIDVVLPDLSFIAAQNDRLCGIVLTHAHEDHLGAVPYLWRDLKAPVYVTPFSAKMLYRKLAEADLLDDFPLMEVDLGARFDVGPFDIELVSVTHSIPEPNAVLIRSPWGHVVHTGDWKIDPTPVVGPDMVEAQWRAIGAEGCRALVCDSTNVLRDGISPSESEVAEGLYEVISRTERRVGVTTFASNLGRVMSVARAAERCGRHLVVVGRALHNIIATARDTGYWTDMPEVLDQDSFGYLPPEKTVCLCTGSQGERRAALSRIAEGSHPDVTFDEGDTVIFSSRTIPGNEKAVSRVHNLLALVGVHIVTADDALVHVTGHPRRGELKQMYDWLRPELVVPMHGEERHLLEHADFAKANGAGETIIAHNGDMVRLAPGPAERVDQVPHGRWHVDGRIIVPSVEGPARDRRKLSFAGLVIVSLALDGSGGLIDDPAVELVGVPRADAEGGSMTEMLLDLVDEVLSKASAPKRRDPEFLENVIYRAVRRAVDAEWGKKPNCRVFVHME